MSTEIPSPITITDTDTLSDISCGSYKIRMNECVETYPCIHTVTDTGCKSFQEMDGVEIYNLLNAYGLSHPHFDVYKESVRRYQTYLTPILLTEEWTRLDVPCSQSIYFYKLSEDYKKVTFTEYTYAQYHSPERYASIEVTYPIKSLNNATTSLQSTFVRTVIPHHPKLKEMYSSLVSPWSKLITLRDCHT